MTAPTGLQVPLRTRPGGRAPVAADLGVVAVIFLGLLAAVLVGVGRYSLVLALLPVIAGGVGVLQGWWTPTAGAGLLLSALIGLPIVGYSNKHLWLFLALVAGFAYVAPRLSPVAPPATPFRAWLVLPVGSTIVAFAATGEKAGWQTGLDVTLVLLAGLSLGAAASGRSILRFLNFLTVLIVGASLIGLVEYARQAPLYAFSPLQQWTPFRASGLLGHPLILATFASAVAVLNLRMAPRTRWPLAVVLPPLLLADIASVSRSISYLLAGGVVLAWAMRGANARRQRLIMLASILIAVALIATTDLAAHLADRFARLTASDQITRLQALNVTRAIVSGYQLLIGGGPGHVSAALIADPALLRQNNGYNTVDNGFLGIFATYGAVGLAGMLAALGLFVRGLRGRRFTEEQRYCALLGLVLLLSCVSFEALAWYPILFVVAWCLGACGRVDRSSAEAAERLGGPATAQPARRSG